MNSHITCVSLPNFVATAHSSKLYREIAISQSPFVDLRSILVYGFSVGGWNNVMWCNSVHVLLALLMLPASLSHSSHSILSLFLSLSLYLSVSSHPGYTRYLKSSVPMNLAPCAYYLFAFSCLKRFLTKQKLLYGNGICH